MKNEDDPQRKNRKLGLKPRPSLVITVFRVMTSVVGGGRRRASMKHGDVENHNILKNYSDMGVG